MKLLNYITEQTASSNKVLNQLKGQYGFYLDKIKHYLEITNEEYCQLLTNLYYSLYAYRFESTDLPESYYDIVTNGDIIVYLDDTLLSSGMIYPVMEENPIFLEAVNQINNALNLINNIDKLKMDLSYLANLPLKFYLKNNIDVMSRKAGNEMSLYGGTKIEALYAIIFGEKSNEYNRVVELTKNYTIDLYREMNL